MEKNSFSLIHVVCDEFETPLLNSQVYERANFQTKNEHAPQQTFVFVFAAIKTIRDKKYYKSINELKRSFYPVKFLLVPYSSRLGPMLSVFFIRCYRFFFIRGKVIFHSRGDGPIQWINKLKRRNDKVVIDIRGYWPIEVFARLNKFDPSDLSLKEKEAFLALEEDLGNNLKHADRIFAVSVPLASYIKNRFKIQNEICVIPCVTSIDKTYIQQANSIGLSSSINVIYLGGAQSYQSLKELVLPFAKALTEISPRVVVHFISQDKPIIDQYLNDFGMLSSRIVSRALPQSEVKKYLKEMDLGLLLRSPSFMNSFSQPVKMGEYLAAGIGIIFEKGTGDLKELLAEQGMGFEVELWKGNDSSIKEEAIKVLSWFELNQSQIRSRCQDFYFNKYNWNAYSIIENNIYHEMINAH